MTSRLPVITFVLNAHLPFICPSDEGLSSEEQWFFESISEIYLPLLQVFDRLDGDHVPFRLGIALSPALCHLLRDEALINRYLTYTDIQIEFGARECERTSRDPDLGPLARLFYDRLVDKRILFTERYERNLLKVFDYYQKKGRLELLATAATYAFLPLYAAHPEAVQAQLEVAAASHRGVFSRNPQGFWLPEMGWTPELDRYLRAYNFGYTMVETHGTLAGEVGAAKGSFYPLMSPSGLFILARDYHAHRDICDAAESPCCRDYDKDVGFDLPAELVRPFLGPQGGRSRTGYRYWTSGGRQIYDPSRAQALAGEQARTFLDARISRLRQAGELMDEAPVSLCAYDADLFGRTWYEGPVFLEALFREGWRRNDEIQFMTPGEYLYKQEGTKFQTLAPEFSSWGINGYGETWLDASNDWMYRHVLRSLDRMVELAERFPNDSGLKERALNQAAREILLIQTSEWPKMLYRQELADYARLQIEGALRNFTTIYESLGSSYISTEWLTSLERRHNIFPTINYRVFRRKR